MTTERPTHGHEPRRTRRHDEVSSANIVRSWLSSCSLCALWFRSWFPSWFAQQVSFDRLLHADKEPQNWLSYSGTVFNQRYSQLTQITPANVKNLELQWIWQARSLEKFEATALAVDGVLYTLQGPPVQGTYQVVALDAVTGRPFWTLEYKPARGRRPVLRPREPRLVHPRRHAVHGHHRCAPARHRRQDRQDPLEHRSGARRGQVRDYARAAGPQGQDHRRRGGRRPRRSRLHRRLQCQGRQGSCGASTRFPVLANPATRRGRATRGRPAARRSGTAAPTTPTRTWCTSGPAIRGRTATAASVSATTCTATASSRSIRTPAS